MINLPQMHKYLRNEKNSRHIQSGDCFCPECGARMGYRYLEEGLYSVKCLNKNCSHPHGFVYARNPYSAMLNAGGLSLKPSYIELQDDGNVAVCTNCGTDLMGVFDCETDIIQCPECGARIAKFIDIECEV